MTYRTFIDLCTDNLAATYPREEARAIAVRALCHFENVPQYKYLSDPDTKVRNEEELTEAAARLAEGMPLQYVLGYAEFAGLRIKVNGSVLIPRPETEQLVGIVIDDLSSVEIDEQQDFNILDICTGSGCIAYALAAGLPSAQLYGCDISADAIRTACKQKVKLEGGRPVFFSADVLAPAPAGLPKFDVIVSNPPYVCEGEKSAMRSNVLDYEPAIALFVPDDDPLKFYRAIRTWCDSMLREGGYCYLEINEAYGSRTAELFEGSQVIKDFNGKDRFIRYKKAQ